MNNGENWSKETYREAEKVIGYTFRDPALLLTAFTHSTYSNLSGEESNERLEFLGDAVLELAVSEDLYLGYPKDDEGALTGRRKNYVSKEALARTEKKLGLMRFLRHSAGSGNLSDKTSSSLIEAVAGAIYLDGGFLSAKNFLKAHLFRAEEGDFKTKLQEFVQERNKSIPEYHVQSDGSGFICTVSALGASETGMGMSKKAAETEAAKRLLGKLKQGI